MEWPASLARHLKDRNALVLIRRSEETSLVEGHDEDPVVFGEFAQQNVQAQLCATPRMRRIAVRDDDDRTTRDLRGERKQPFPEPTMHWETLR
jgi:hypothetical protein